MIKTLRFTFGYPLSPFQEKTMSTRFTVHRFHLYMFYVLLLSLAVKYGFPLAMFLARSGPSFWWFSDSSNIVGEEYLQSRTATLGTLGLFVGGIDH